MLFYLFLLVLNYSKLKDFNVKISRLAQGIPVGGEIENLDDGTLVSAFKNRKEISD